MIDVALKEIEFVGQHLYITFIYPRFWLFWAITAQQNYYVHYNGYLFLHLIEIKHQWKTEKLTEQTNEMRSNLWWEMKICTSDIFSYYSKWMWITQDQK